MTRSMPEIAPENAGQHGVRCAHVDQHRADQRWQAAHVELRDFGGDAVAIRKAQVLGPVLAIARVVPRIDEFEIAVPPEPQTEALNAHLDHVRAPNEDGVRDVFVDDHLRRAQHALLLALGVDNALRRALRGIEHRLHNEPGVIHELAQSFAIGIEVCDRARGDPARHCRLRHRRRDLADQPRIERLGDEVFRAKGKVLLAVRHRDDVRLLGLRELGDRVHRGELHLIRDGRCAAKTSSSRT